MIMPQAEGELSLLDSLQLEVQSLRQQLDESKEKLQEYTDLIVSQANELKTFRETICHACREKIFCTSLAPSHACSGSSLSVQATHRQSNIGSRLPTPALEAKSLPRPTPHSVSQKIDTTVFQPTDGSCSAVQVSPSQTYTIEPKPGWLVVQNSDLKQVPVVNFERVLVHDTSVHSVRFSSDGKYFAVGLGWLSGKTYIYTTRTGKNICILADYTAKLVGIWAVCFSPDNSTLATGGSRGLLQIWEVVRRRVRASFRAHALDVRSLDFSPNGRLLVSADDVTICIWNIRDGFSKVFSTGVLRLRMFSCIKFSPNGNCVVGGNTDNSTSIWNVRTGQLAEKWVGHERPVRSVTFTPDGNGLITSSEDNTIKHWEPASALGLTTAFSESCLIQEVAVEKKENLRFTGHKGDVRSVAVSPNGYWVLSGGEDRTARIWNARNAVWQCSLQGHSSTVRAVEFSPAGDYLVLGSFDHRVTVWKFQAD